MTGIQDPEGVCLDNKDVIGALPVTLWLSGRAKVSFLTLWLTISEDWRVSGVKPDQAILLRERWGSEGSCSAWAV